MEHKLRVVILTGTDSTATCMTIVPLLSIPEVEVSAILFDTNPQTLHRRYKNLKRNIKRECWGYLPYRALSFIIKFLDARAASVIPDDEVRHLLRKALPEKYYSLSDLAQAYRIPIIRVQNLNSTEAIGELRKLEADLGIVLGTRVLKRSTFSVPKLG